MDIRHKACLLVLLTVTTFGCDKLTGKKPAPHRKKPASTSLASAAPSSSTAPARSPHDSPSPSSTASHASGHGDSAPDATKRFALPFAWEHGDNEPLAKTRAFMKEVLRDNRDYMKHGPKFFEAFAKVQKPRATVVSCSDSRVQSAAWDLSPENDDFTIRNIGNQIASSRGSVEYGVEHLNTAVLLLVGHTGCGAVKAAMGDKSHLSDPIRAEIDSLVIPKDLDGQSSDSAWEQAVVANVHEQVRVGLEQFADRVHEGRLTVIGAVYDFRNDLGKGPGKLMIIDVNGNSEPARLDAFVAAVSGVPLKSGAEDSPNALGPAAADPPIDPDTSIEHISSKLEKLGEQNRTAH